MIEREEVEIGITSFYANSERAEVVDFSPILDYAELVYHHNFRIFNHTLNLLSV